MPEWPSRSPSRWRSASARRGAGPGERESRSRRELVGRRLEAGSGVAWNGSGWMLPDLGHQQTDVVGGARSGRRRRAPPPRRRRRAPLRECDQGSAAHRVSLTALKVDFNYTYTAMGLTQSGEIRIGARLRQRRLDAGIDHERGGRAGGPDRRASSASSNAISPPSRSPRSTGSARSSAFEPAI